MNKYEKEEVKEAAAFLPKIGIRNGKILRVFWPIFENNYIKFCSDSGVSDETQADLFQKWLDKKELKYERVNERAFMLSKRASSYVTTLMALDDAEKQAYDAMAAIQKLKKKLENL